MTDDPYFWAAGGHIEVKKEPSDNEGWILATTNIFKIKNAQEAEMKMLNCKDPMTEDGLIQVIDELKVKYKIDEVIFRSAI